MIKIIFVLESGESVNCLSAAGKSILEIAQENGIELEGSCEGSMACSTCHVVIDKEWFKQLEDPSDEECDMLELAYGLTAMSRLGCQIKLESRLDGIVVHVPPDSYNNS